jgi:outer membrane protein assembly factor BamB
MRRELTKCGEGFGSTMLGAPHRRRRMLTAGLLIVAVLIAWGKGEAGDWPQFRRDAARTGNAPDEALTLPLKRAVAVRFPAPIYASAAVVAGRAYIQDACGNLACVDVKANRALWVTPLGGRNNSSSPALVGGRVYIGNDDGAFFIVDAGNGKIVKKLVIPGGVVAAPAVANNAVYFPSFDGVLYKATLDGDVVWTFKGGWTSHQEIAVRGKYIVFFSGPVQEKDGLGKIEKEVKWGVNMWDATRLLLVRDEGTSAVAELAGVSGVATGGPVWIRDSKIVYQDFDSEQSRIAVIDFGEARKSMCGVIRVPGGPTGDHFLYELCRSDSRSVFAVRDDMVYTGRLCFMQDCSRYVWRASEPLAHCGAYHSGPALSRDFQIVGGQDGRIYFSDITGDAEAAAKPVADPKEKPPQRKPAWVYETPLAGTDTADGGIVSAPAIAAGTVFVGTVDGLLLGLGTGREATPCDVLPPTSVARPDPPRLLPGGQWPFMGGDEGNSHVSSDTTVKPPFRVRWKTKVWGVYKAPLLAADGRIFATSRFGDLFALDADTGRILWSQFVTYGESMNGSMVLGDKVIVSRSGQGLFCFDVASGRRLWHRQIPDERDEYTAAALLVCQQVNETTLRITAIAPDTGKDAWVRDIPDVLTARKDWRGLKASAVAGDGRWYVSASINGTAAKDPERKDKSLGWWNDETKMIAGIGITLALDPKDGTVLWSDRERFRHTRGGLMFRNGVLAVFGAHGCSAHEAKTGAVLWTAPIKRVANVPSYGGYLPHPLSDAFLGAKGMAATLGTHTCSAGVWANGLVYGHRRAISNYSGVLDPATGKEVWRYRLPTHVCPHPTPAYGRLYVVGNGEGVIYCFEPEETPERGWGSVECPSETALREKRT